MRFREHRLANGLEIIAEINPAAYSTAIAFFVKTGARDETDALSGVSHFLEHMMFKGTPTRSAADVNRELDEMGAQSNAFTSEEQTVYYVAVLPEYQDRALDLLCDIMRPSLRGEDFETEKQVILEEIAKYEDQPPFGAHEKSMTVHFRDHPLARSVLGTPHTVSAMTAPRMREYFEPPVRAQQPDARGCRERRFPAAGPAGRGAVWSLALPAGRAGDRGRPRQHRLPGLSQRDRHPAICCPDRQRTRRRGRRPFRGADLEHRGGRR